MINEGTLPTQMWSFLLPEVRTPPSADRARGLRLKHFDWAYSDSVEGYHRDSSAWWKWACEAGKRGSATLVMRTESEDDLDYISAEKLGQ